MKIRPSLHKDSQQLMQLNNLIWNVENTPHPHKWESLAAYEERCPPGSQYVAVIDESVAGFIRYRSPIPLDSNRHVWELVIGVHPDFQGQKVGSTLLRFVEKEAKKQGIHKLCLRVLATNLSAIHFYERNGYVEQGRLVDEFFLEGKYVDDLMMYRILN
ncbi:GNAT family N-acetyltransferase [Sediminibacillus dalangtanensis]|uniref:GNAT family N-acetyltransferase n=1 Tax=Sediminibacillus dalangtanensis TaxID=2729421 RepID=A0ABX7VQZ9_9BACI|nr:GNAT family N-acetyltransferase [Sediminibacillus dalangtanensis]QTM98928.1 GNAT family N-acetyltransferase [Sediminibacillus dalangtanensis]